MLQLHRRKVEEVLVSKSNLDQSGVRLVEICGRWYNMAGKVWLRIHDAAGELIEAIDQVRQVRPLFQRICQTYTNVRTGHAMLDAGKLDNMLLWLMIRPVSVAEIVLLANGGIAVGACGWSR